MKALLQSGYGHTEVLRVDTTPRPSPGPGEVLVKVEAAAIDRGTWHLMTGRPYLMRLMGFGLFAPKEPVAGLDLAGTVVEVGVGVARFRAGDDVLGTGRGSFAEFARARVDKLVHKPKSLSFAEAAALAVSGGTALQAIDAAKLLAGERVLIVGASGGVGTYAVQMAKARGAHVTGVASTAKLETVRAVGADRVIDYRTTDFTTEPYDVILDLGGNTPLSRLRGALTPTGRLVFVGGENGGDWTAGFGRQMLALLLAPFVRQRFILLASREHHTVTQRVVDLVEGRAVTPVIDRRIPLRQVPGALVDLEAGRVCGKVVVEIAA
ncbi:MAG: NAD(P)-dependent alcohol dehydrogenase [Vicinamibacteria bacterium]|nr:NAD(P)-dependent alcohol dehydrogenase [Vicinamibacteria bacterium]